VAVAGLTRAALRCHIFRLSDLVLADFPQVSDLRAGPLSCTFLARLETVLGHRTPCFGIFFSAFFSALQIWFASRFWAQFQPPLSVEFRQLKLICCWAYLFPVFGDCFSTFAQRGSSVLAHIRSGWARFFEHLGTVLPRLSLRFALHTSAGSDSGKSGGLGAVEGGTVSF
jgi:hypothetical protein